MFGVHRSTYYALEAEGRPQGLEMLRPRERRRPRMPNQLSPMVEQRIVAYALGHPGAGPDRIAAELGATKWGGIVVSPNGVWRVLRRHGLNTRAKRLALVAGYAAPYEPPRAAPTEQHIQVDGPASWSASTASSSAGCAAPSTRSGSSPRSTSTPPSPGPSWSPAPPASPPRNRPAKLARRVAADLARAAGGSNASSPTTATSFAASFDHTLDQLGTRHTRIRAGRPQTNGHVERLHKTILDECWRPASPATSTSASAASRRDLTDYLHYYNTDRAHTGRITHGRIPADIVYGAHKMEPR